MCVLDCNVRHISYYSSWWKSWRAIALMNIGKERGWISSPLGLFSESNISLSTPVSLWVSLLINPENHWSDVLTVKLWHMGYQRRKKRRPYLIVILQPHHILWFTQHHGDSAWSIREARQRYGEWILDTELQIKGPEMWRSMAQLWIWKELSGRDLNGCFPSYPTSLSSRILLIGAW